MKESLHGYQIGDHVVTPMGQEAIVQGINQDRLDLRYVEGDSVALKPSLVKRISAEVFFRD